jgi:hypothetical protein
MRKLAACVLLALLTGCASTYRQDGLAANEPAAIVEMEGSDAIIQEVDGKWRGLGTFKQYELKPGVRKLRLIYVGQGAQGSQGVQGAKAIIVEFNAEAGRTYVARSNANLTMMKWDPVVLDARTQQVVSKQVGTAFAY